jgi:hypothetical protein
MATKMATKPNPKMAALLMAAKKRSATPPMDSQPMMPGQAMPGTPGMMRKGGSVKKMASGGKAGQLSKANGVASKGKSKGTMIKMSKGGKYC